MGRVPVEITGPAVVLPSRYDVTTLASDAVASATLAAAQLLAARTGERVRHVQVDRVAACAAFLGERLFRPDGWRLPPAWDPIAGDYRTADGWIRLHTNYSHHRAAVLRALRLPDDGTSRETAADAARRRGGEELEAAVVAHGGAAAVLHSTAVWSASTPGRAARRDRLTVELAPAAPIALPAAELPLSGIRVLDLTRVIAGPVCTRFLAAYGAEVLRIDPPGFEEVPALLPEVTPGKRCAAVDLRTGSGRDRFLALVRQAHVVVSGLRDGALAGLGLGLLELRAQNPSLITARLNAYGFDGPWRGRRGFDSLVQMSCGIAYLDAGWEPSPLPAQALDHATGYLLAAAVCRAVTHLVRTGIPSDIRTSLVATANVLMDLPVPVGDAPVDPGWPDEVFENVRTWWGPALRVRVPGSIEGVIPSWSVEAGPLGRHQPAFE
ncbi:CoA transferase [Nakamurella sp. GG22]